MKKFLIFFFLICMNFTNAAEEDLESSPFVDELLEIIYIVKNETTVREWKLYCEITQRELPDIFFAMADEEIYKLSWEEAFVCSVWLLSNGQDRYFLSKILNEIDECPAPTGEQISALCLHVSYPERDETTSTIAYNYHRSLWEMSCASPEEDSREVGREKVRKMWAKYKEKIRCPPIGSSLAEDLNITKFAIVRFNHRFTYELVVVYKLDFNFIDEKDGMTLLDFVQDMIEFQERQVPPAEELIQYYERIYNGIVKNGGKHAKDLSP